MDFSKLEKKKQLTALKSLPPSLAKWFDIELTYTSNAIEGNSLSREETRLIVEEGAIIEGKSLVEHLEATNHTRALDFIKGLVNLKPLEITENHILGIHHSILRGIDDDNAGRYRQVIVRISGSTVVFPNPIKVPDLISDFMQWLHSCKDHPLLLAAMAHYKLVTIHPFIDGNGRTARLLMNLLAMSAGYPPAIISPENRLEYINALEKAQLGGSLDDFLQIVYTAIDRSLDIYLEAAEN